MNYLDITLLILAGATSAFALCAWKKRGIGLVHSGSFKTLADVAPAGIWRTTADGHCVYITEALQKQTGLSEEECIGNGWAEAIHPDDRDRVFAKWFVTVARREQYRDEWRWLRPDGSTLWVTTLGGPEFDHKGELAGYVGINIDIQRSKELELELKDVRVRAEETTAAKIEAGQMDYNPEPTDVRQKIRHCVRLLEPQALAKGLVIEQSVSEDFPQMIEADRLRLRQILMNLIGNAVKFTERGRVDVRATVEELGSERCAVITVADTRIGISAAKLDRIFDPFTQEDGSITRRYGGTGLGLSITNRLVERMGVRIDVSSQSAVGTAFMVRFPLKQADAAFPELPMQLGSSDWSALAGTRVLIAEDHQINQQLIMSMAEMLRLDASLVEDGDEAVAAVVQASREGRPYDVVLMDVQMPRMDGHEASRTLREHGFHESALPIVALTANCYADDIAACREAGMQAHVGKPVNCAALARELLAVLREAWPEIERAAA